MIVNVIDLRENPFRWGRVLAIAEDAGRATVSVDGDRLPASADLAVDYAERDGVSVHEALRWAEHLPGPVVLTLYDVDGDTAE